MSFGMSEKKQNYATWIQTVLSVKRVIELMKDELGGKIMTKTAALRPKTYSYLTDDNENKKAKGTKKSVIKKKLKFEDYKNCLIATHLKNKKHQLVSFDRSNNNGSTAVKVGGSIIEEKSSFKMLGLTFSSKLNWGSYIISIAKTASKKIGALIRSMKFLSPEVALYLYKSTIRPCMEYCCHVWDGAPSCYLDLLDKLQKQICRIVGPSLAASLEPLAHR